MGVVIAAHNSFALESHRRIDRDIRTGRLWTIALDASSDLRFYYSDDDGDTWALSASLLSDYGSHANLFVDLDGGINVAYSNSSNYFIYRRGTVNADNTITWGNETGQINSPVLRPYDMVVFRNPAEPGWIAWIAMREVGDYQDWHMMKYFIGTDQNVVGYLRFGGLVSLWGGQTSGGDNRIRIDFHHTGDGKTVAGGVADVYLSFYHYSTAYYLMFPNGAIWPRNLRSLYSNYGIALIAYDGTRVLAGYKHTTTGVVGLYERDAGDTQTTNRGISPALGAAFDDLSMSYDRDGNVHFFARRSDDYDRYRVTWNRATATWDASWTLVVAAAATTGYYINSLRVGWAGARWPVVEGVYNDGTNLLYQTVLELNAAPSAPTITAPADGSVQDVAAVLPVQWQFNDPDAGDAQSAYTLRRRIGTGAYAYWMGSAWLSSESASTKLTSAVTALSLPVTWGADSDADHYYAVKTWDSVNQVSPWSAETRVVPSSQDNPTITAPATNGATITTARYNVAWTVASQSKYRLRVLGDDAGDPDPAVVDFDSGIKISTSVRLDEVRFPTNGVDRHIELTTWNDEGLQSTIVYRQVAVSFTPPAVPLVTLNADDWVPDAIVVTINNTGSGAVEDYNDIYRRVQGDLGEGIRIATGVNVDGAITDYAVASEVEYEYRARTYSTDGATANSAWVV